MDRPCSVNAAVAGSTRPAASRSARPAPRASVPRGGDLSARRSMTARFHAAPPAISLRRSTGRVSTGARAQSEQNENESKGADAGLSQGVPAGFYRACVDNIVEKTVQGPCVMLRVLDDGPKTRVLPVFIGVSECNSLLSAIKKRPHQRPLTHDLMKNTFEMLDYKVTMVQVTHLRDGTYFGRLFVKKYLASANEYDYRDVDARPSDAINVAVRCGAPIFISKEVVATSSITVDGVTPPRITEPPPPQKKVKKLDSAIAIRMQLAVAVAQQRYEDAASLSKMIAAMTGHDEGSGLLILQMEQAVRDERYQDAATIRDQLAKLNVELSD